MATVTLINAQTAAVTAPAYAKFSTNSYSEVLLSATGLAGAEEVDVFIASGDDWVLAVDKQGAVAKLTVSKPSIELVPGPIYGVLKDATVAPSSVSVTLNAKQ